jgi:hypothetical protein
MMVGAPDILECLGPAPEKALRDALRENLPKLTKKTAPLPD